MANSTTPQATIGGIPIVWIVVLACAVIVIGICALTYPLILLNRWRMKEKMRSDNDELDYEEEEENYSEPKFKAPSIFGRGRKSVRGKWVERMDPQSGSPYYENTGTGEVTWTDPRTKKKGGRIGNNQQQLVPAANFGQPPPMNFGGPPMNGPPGGYGGAPGGFGGAPRGPMPGAPMPAPHIPQQQQFGGPMPPGMAPGGVASPPPIRRTQGPPPPVPGGAAPAPAAAPAAPAADPKFDKYSRMQKAGLPEGAIRNAMNRDGISDAEQKTFFGS